MGRQTYIGTLKHMEGHRQMGGRTDNQKGGGTDAQTESRTDGQTDG
jgi:hypothetical protein